MYSLEVSHMLQQITEPYMLKFIDQNSLLTIYQYQSNACQKYFILCSSQCNIVLYCTKQKVLDLLKKEITKIVSKFHE